VTFFDSKKTSARCCYKYTYRSFAITLSQLKMSDFSGETFKGFWSATIFYECNDDTTALSGEFYKLRYDTIPVKSASANISFYTNNSKMPNFELWHSCRQWTICLRQKYPLFLPYLNETWIFSTGFFNIQILNFMKIRPLSAEWSHSDRRTDWQTWRS